MRNEGLTNNGNRRIGIDRREFSYTAYLPERRSGPDRRGIFDYRCILTKKIGNYIRTYEKLKGCPLNYKFLSRSDSSQISTLD
jgi:hypothetical protein